MLMQKNTLLDMHVLPSCSYLSEGAGTATPKFNLNKNSLLFFLLRESCEKAPLNINIYRWWKAKKLE